MATVTEWSWFSWRCYYVFVTCTVTEEQLITIVVISNSNVIEFCIRYHELIQQTINRRIHTDTPIQGTWHPSPKWVEWLTQTSQYEPIDIPHPIAYACSTTSILATPISLVHTQSLRRIVRLVWNIGCDKWQSFEIQINSAADKGRILLITEPSRANEVKGEVVRGVMGRGVGQGQGVKGGKIDLDGIMNICIVK